MSRRFAQLTFTEGVKAMQRRYGARLRNERYEASEVVNTELGVNESAFIALRDSFYLATVSETGWPYVQHRGGSPGFLKVLGATTLVFADLPGNQQFQSLGNLAGNDRVCLILVDYAQRRRLKLLGHARLLTPGEADAWQISDAGEKIERMVLVEVEAFDWNCARHITPRFSAQEMQCAIEPLQQRIDLLEALLHQLGCEPP